MAREAPTASLLQATPTAAVVPATASVEGFVPPDEAMQLLFDCGLIGRVSAYFRVPEGNDIWDHLPKLGLAPEIEGKSGLFVAIYDGEVSGLFFGQPGASREPVTDALCVIDRDSAPNVYANVSREGMQLPSGAYVAAPDEWLLPTPH